MEQFLYLILRGITRTFNFLPLSLLYFVSDFFYLNSYYILKYRRRVVRENLQNSFPELPLSEIIKIEKKFYRHISDVSVETLYFSDISKKEVEKRISIENPELPMKYLKEGRQVITSLGHYNNWEWISSLKLFLDTTYYPVYKPLHSKAFDKFYFRLRSRFGATPIDKNQIFKRLYKDAKEGIPSISGFINDQSPKRDNIQYWTTFLNQKTAMFLGVEKISKKLDAVVLAAEIEKTKRGYYNVRFTLITENAKHEPPYAITQKDAQHLESIIKKNPEYWLWSHKRWKHKKEEQ